MSLTADVLDYLIHRSIDDFRSASSCIASSQSTTSTVDDCVNQLSDYQDKATTMSNIIATDTRDPGMGADGVQIQPLRIGSNDTTEELENEGVSDGAAVSKGWELVRSWYWSFIAERRKLIRRSRLLYPQRCKFALEGPALKSVACVSAPWTAEAIHEDRVIPLPQFVQQRAPPFGETYAYFGVPAKHREMLWGVIQMAHSHKVPDEILFRSSGPGRSFTLMPYTPSSIPLQWLHVGPGAIYDSLADAPCAEMDDAELLARLNSIIGTDFALEIPGLRDCLHQVRQISHDFGTAYGTLRPWWSYDFLEIPALMKQRKAELEELRSHALRGPCIIDPTIPVRRVWDLFSNRVLPFHTLPRDPNCAVDDVPPNIWCVSHSWVDEKDRRAVWTMINGEEWPVPLPSMTTLAHVRIELLNMGAQYVWLDILCLRQQGGNAPDAETLRTEEWRLDVPTIGNIFQRQNVPCITYFNGLGLPAEFSSAILGSPRHWCNRVWTVQEGCNAWLPGGIDPGRPLGRGFFEDLSIRGDMILAEMTYLEMATFMKGRHCTSELDRIAGLAYLLKCETLPVYDERMPADAVWLVLIKHLPDEVRTHIFFQFAPVTPFALWPPWSRFLAGQPELLHPPHDLSDGMHKLLYPELFGAMVEASRHEQRTVHLADASQLYSENMQARYCNRGYALGPCRVSQPTRNVPGRARQDVYLEFIGDDEPLPLEFHAMHGLLLPGIDYTLVGFSFGSDDGFLDWWVAIEVVAEEQAGELLTVEAARWAVLVMDGEQAAFVENLKPHMHDIRVVYLPGEEALARTRFRKEYLRAIRWTASMLGYTFDTEST